MAAAEAEEPLVLSDEAQTAVDGLNGLGEKELLDALVHVLVDKTTVLQGLIDWALPEHAYVPSKAIIEQRFEGRVSKFAPEKGYGFIASPSIKEAFGNDVFVRDCQLGQHTMLGTEVNFAVLLNKEHKPQAFDITPGGAAAQQLKGQGKGGFKAGAQAAWGAPAAKGGWGGEMAAKGGWGAASPVVGGGYGAAKGAAKGYAASAPYGAKGGDPYGAKGGWGAPPAAAYGWGAAPAKGKSAPKGFEKGFAPGKSGKAYNSANPTETPQTQSEMPGVTDMRFSGVLKSFNDAKGFGFIASPDLVAAYGQQCDVFVHSAQMKQFDVGANVSFQPILNKQGKPQAVELEAE